jgi:hypothetical protein
MKYSLLLLGFFLWVPTAIFTQEIYLENASFEDPVNTGVIPFGWIDCSNNGQLLPDIESSKGKIGASGAIINYRIPVIEGETFLSLYTDKWGNTSAIGQQLFTPLEAGRCYLFSLYAAFVRTPVPQVAGKRPKLYEPLQLQIWGSNNPKERSELLAESHLIDMLGWRKEKFILEPLQTWKYLILDISAVAVSTELVDGKVLIDNASPIIGIDCETINFETEELFTEELDPLYNYPAYLKHLLSENWNRPIFEKDEAILTLGAKSLLKEIAKNTADARYYRIYFSVKGSDTLAEQRAETIKNLLKEHGLKKRLFYTNTVMASDFKKEWLAKNKEVWVRIVHI